MLGALDGSLDGTVDGGRDGVGVRDGDGDGEGVSDREARVVGVVGAPGSLVVDVVNAVAVADDPPAATLCRELADTVPDPVAVEAPAFT